MTDSKQEKAKVVLRWRILTFVFIVTGVGLILYFGINAVRSFQRVQYIQEQGLETGSASVDAIRGWMTIRYIGVAYAVPEEYIYAQLEIPFERRNRNQPLGRLNEEYKLGSSPKGDYPAIIDQAREAILAYQENPVATGLHDIRDWMSLLYVANSTGVPIVYLFEGLAIPREDNNEYKQLDRLARDLQYPQGYRALEENLGRILKEYEPEP